MIRLLESDNRIRRDSLSPLTNIWHPQSGDAKYNPRGSATPVRIPSLKGFIHMKGYDTQPNKDGRTVLDNKPVTMELRGELIEATHHITCERNHLLHLYLGTRSDGIDIVVPLCSDKSAYARSERGKAALGLETDTDGDSSDDSDDDWDYAAGIIPSHDVVENAGEMPYVDPVGGEPVVSHGVVVGDVLRVETETVEEEVQTSDIDGATRVWETTRPARLVIDPVGEDYSEMAYARHMGGASDEEVRANEIPVGAVRRCDCGSLTVYTTPPDISPADTGFRPEVCCGACNGSYGDDSDEKPIMTDGGVDVDDDNDFDVVMREEDTKNDDEQMRIDDFGGRRLLTDGGTDHENAQKTINVHDENIPKTFKDHDRWLLWDASNDTPRRPHWRGDFGISYNDPADWHTFEEALEAAKSNPSWGIGFVTTNTPVTVIDLDGCRRTDGSYAEQIFKFKWWVPDEFSGEISEYFKEFSPSKTGVHLPVIGFDVPDWWSDKSFEDGHEGVDILDNKFCTVTGMGDGDLPVLDVTDEDAQWLGDALADMYEAITDEDPRADPDTPSPGYSPGDEWLQPADVQAALGYIDADVGYPEWRNIGFAVAEYFSRVGEDIEDDAFDIALETFEEWSQTGEKWDREAEKNAFNIIKAGFDGGDENDSHVSLGTLLHVAERNGWECPDVRERKAYRDVREFIDEWPVVEDRSEDFDEDEFDDAEKKVANAIIRVNSGHYNTVIDDVVDRVNTFERRVHEHREIGRVVEERGSEAFHHGGELVSATKPEDSPWYTTTTLLNFKLDVEAILDVEDENRMAQVHVDPTEPNESPFDLEVEPRTFNDARRFKDTVLAERFSTVIEAPMHDNDVMDLIRQYIASLDVPTRYGQYEMGLSEDGSEFVTPTGTITPDGWTDDPGNVHIEQGSKTNATVRAFSAEPDTHCAIDTDDVARMIELVSQSRESDRMAVILGWFYAAPHRRQIADLTMKFNPMAVTGRSGSGKTATLAALNQMWGMDTEPQSAEASKHGMLTGFASSRGVPVWFDEYRPEKMPDYVVDRFHTFYKKAATGGVEPRGNRSMGTDDWHLRSPVVVSGESEIRSDAERRRTVNVTVTKKPVQDGHPAKKAFKALVGDVTVDDDGNVQFPEANYDLQDHAVAYYSWVTGMGDDEFRDAWFAAREKVAELLDEWGDAVELGDTEIQALQTVVFGYRRMVTFADAVGADLSKLPSPDNLEDALELVADVDGDGRQPHEHQFLSLVSRAAAAGYLEDATDYRVVHEGKANEELRVNITRAFDKVSKFARDHDLNEDLLQSASDYKTRFVQLEDEGTFVTVTSQPTQGISRCTGIDMSRGVEEVAGFARESFVDIDDDDDGEIVNTGDDGDGGNGPTPVAAVSPYSGTGYDTVAVEVTKWETPDNDKVAARGTVKDATSPIRIIDFDGGSPEGIEAGDCYRIENVEVGEFDGNTQLVVEEGTTEFVPVQRGVGHISPAEAEDGQALIGSDASATSHTFQEVQDGVRADSGGDECVDKQIDQATLQHAESAGSDAELAWVVAQQVGCDDLERVEYRIARLRERGDISIERGAVEQPLADHVAVVMRQPGKDRIAVQRAAAGINRGD